MSGHICGDLTCATCGTPEPDLQTQLDALKKEVRSLTVFVANHLHETDSRGRMDRHHHTSYGPRGGSRLMERI